MANIAISFVIGSLNEGENLKKTLRSLRDSVTEDFEIIVVDDGSTDYSCDFIERENTDPRIHLYRTDRLGSANSKNYGAEKASGDIICFLDAHVLFTKGWIKPLLQQLEDEGVGIVAPALASWSNRSAKAFGMLWRNARLDMIWLPQRSIDPYPVAMVGLACMAFRRQVFAEIGGFDHGLRSYGSTDQEVCLHAWLLGYEVKIVPQVVVAHLFRTKFPYPVCWSNTVHNKLRTVSTYFNPTRQRKSIKALESLPGFRQANELLNKSEIQQRREKLLKIQKYDDDWFMEKFGMNI